MANTFNGRLDLISSNQISVDVWKIKAQFVDNSGIFTAKDAKIGDVIYNDGSILNCGMYRYIIESIEPTTTFSILECYIKWSLPDNEPFEPFTGFETCIGGVTDGVMFVPSPSLQILTDTFIQYVRNTEMSLTSRNAYQSRIMEEKPIGLMDGINFVYSTSQNFVPGTVEAYFNGQRLKTGFDYFVQEPNILTFMITPLETDQLYVNYNHK